MSNQMLEKCYINVMKVLHILCDSLHIIYYIIAQSSGFVNRNTIIYNIFAREDRILNRSAGAACIVYYILQIYCKECE